VFLCVFTLLPPTYPPHLSHTSSLLPKERPACLRATHRVSRRVLRVAHQTGDLAIEVELRHCPAEPPHHGERLHVELLRLEEVGVRARTLDAPVLHHATDGSAHLALTNAKLLLRALLGRELGDLATLPEQAVLATLVAVLAEAVDATLTARVALRLELADAGVELDGRASALPSDARRGNDDRRRNDGRRNDDELVVAGSLAVVDLVDVVIGDRTTLGGGGVGGGGHGAERAGRAEEGERGGWGCNDLWGDCIAYSRPFFMCCVFVLFVWFLHPTSTDTHAS